MKTIYVVEKKHVKILWLESLIVAAFIGFIVKTSFKLDSTIGIAVGIVSYLVCVFLFFNNKWFRYIFTLGASYLWANFAYEIALKHTSGHTPFLLAVIVFGVVAAWHVDHFSILKGNILHR